MKTTASSIYNLVAIQFAQRLKECRIKNSLKYLRNFRIFFIICKINLWEHKNFFITEIHSNNLVSD